MRRRLVVLKHFTPSIALLGIAILITLFAHPHIVVPIILIIGAIVLAQQNYKVLKIRAEVEKHNEE